MTLFSRHLNILKPIGLTVAISLAAYSCVWEAGDEGILDEELMFAVSTGKPADDPTRSLTPADTSAGPETIALRSDGLSIPLYIHTYITDRKPTEEVVTRSTPVNEYSDFKAANASDGFGVTGFSSTGETHIPEFSAAKPISGGDVWGTDPLTYWPKAGKKLRFVAFAPLAALSTGTESATEPMTDLNIGLVKTTFSYTVPNGTSGHDAERQPDLMFATNFCDKSGSDNGKVPMNFKHALSAIKFAVRDVVDGVVESISISGVAGSGKCTYNYDTQEFAWSEQGAAERTYSQTFNYKVDGVASSPSGESSDVVLNDRMPEKTFMLIPQEIPSDAEIAVVFKRGKDGQTFTLRGKIIDSKVMRWEPGKEYVYTISTSSSNWIYHFEVIGSEQAVNDENPSKGGFSDAQGRIVVNQTVIDGAYYKVLSWRERANNPSIKEIVPWTAEASKGKTSFPNDGKLSGFISKYWDEVNTEIDAKVWIPKNTWSASGSITSTRYDLSFFPQITGTDWEGDWQMRTNPEVASESNPRDLSMVTGTRNTANCYVVNAPGHYRLPLVYGNAITNGSLNSSCYTFGNGDISGVGTALRRFTDYNGNAISGARISGAQSAILVWQDAYNLVSDVKLETNGPDGYDYVTFKVNRDELQQGNVVLAVKDGSGTIIWSWHIWVDEHWFRNNTDGVIGNGDVVFDAWNGEYGQFTSAPYNLGWCDPKNVWYLKRTGTMVFRQAHSGNTVTLNLEQREKKIEYWIGNNVYYQFGRKDPIVGFMNSGSVVKYNFGEYDYELRPQFVNIADGIRNPNVLYVGANISYTTGKEHWLNTNYYNLWNNTGKSFGTVNKDDSNNDYQYSGVKTVYDPSPAGYQVPPVGYFKIMVNSNVLDNFGAGNNIANYFNGTYEGMNGHDGYYIYYVYTKRNRQGDRMALTGTGERWYKNYDVGGISAGGNFNPAIVYLWSNQIIWSNGGTRSGAGLALGGVTSNYWFIGAAAMARPIRPVRTFNR